MTKEELKAHCEKQIEMCEFWAIGKGGSPSSQVYEEHKLILELLEQENCNVAKLTPVKTLEDEYGEYIYLSDMPKDNEYVLVQTYKDGYDEYMLTHCTIENGRYLMDNGNEFGERVKAWMSLPTEYKE